MKYAIRSLDRRDFEWLGQPAALVTEPDYGTPEPRRVVFAVTSNDRSWWRDIWLPEIECGFVAYDEGFETW